MYVSGPFRQSRSLCHPASLPYAFLSNQVRFIRLPDTACIEFGRHGAFLQMPPCTKQHNGRQVAICNCKLASAPAHADKCKVCQGVLVLNMLPNPLTAAPAGTGLTLSLRASPEVARPCRPLFEYCMQPHYLVPGSCAATGCAHSEPWPGGICELPSCCVVHI